MASRPPSPDHVRDPGARWAEIRRQWTSPPPHQNGVRPSSPSSPADPTTVADAASTPSDAAPTSRRRDPLFQERISTLEQMLRAANASPASRTTGVALPPAVALLAVPAQGAGRANAESTGAGSSGSVQSGAAAGQGKGKGKLMDEEEPDGGDVIGGAGREDEPDRTQELKKVSEGIFLAFKQNRALKEPLPLSLVTSLLFRSWMLDGTIPLNYVPEPDPPSPAPRNFAPSCSTAASPSPLSLAQPPASTPLSSRGGTPSLLATLSLADPNAVTPLPSEPSDFAVQPVTPPPLPASSAAPLATEEGSMPPPPLPKPALAPLQPAATATAEPDLEGAGARGESGKLKLDMMRGSRWRTEKDIASGSDVI
ncbi:hypothetical protein JCM10207_004584 [Rhodosporidiobolus poonsookiae]